MKLFGILKAIIIVIFLVFVGGKYFGYIDNYQISESIYLYDMAYVFLAIYVLLRIAEFVSNRKSNQDE